MARSHQQESKLKLKKLAHESLLSVEKQFLRISKESHCTQKQMGNAGQSNWISRAQQKKFVAAHGERIRVRGPVHRCIKVRSASVVTLDLDEKGRACW